MNEKKKEHSAIDVVGLMSGTSLDGLDLCCVHFEFDGTWRYRIVKAESVDYPQPLREALASAQTLTAQAYARLHSDYGLYLGEQVKAFVERNRLHADLVASHGQTIFHQPEIRFTAQIGSGAGIAAVTGIDTVCDFRTVDVALGGQGAPLVPIGDAILFGDYDYCLNMGGFSNISFAEGPQRLAFDISPVNYVLNHYASFRGQAFDRDGNLARSGQVCTPLLDALNKLPFYAMEGPKSLGREWVEQEVYPLIDSFGLSAEDVLATFAEHVAVQIGRKIRGGRVLVTGGGARNTFLLERMRAQAPQAQYVVPDLLTVDFKEALIFALLGALFATGQANCLASVTGAVRDSIGGCLYKGK